MGKCQFGKLDRRTPGFDGEATGCASDAAKIGAGENGQEFTLISTDEVGRAQEGIASDRQFPEDDVAHEMAPVGSHWTNFEVVPEIDHEVTE